MATRGDVGNILGKDPLLLPLADNGGPSKTMAFDTSTPGPALGTGAVTFAKIFFFGVGRPLQYDQRGIAFPRKLDGKVDMGAWQNQESRIFVFGFEPDDSSLLIP